MAPQSAWTTAPVGLVREWHALLISYTILCTLSLSTLSMPAFALVNTV